MVAAPALAARPFFDEPDTGLGNFLTGDGSTWEPGTLPNLRDIRSLPDFQFAARQVLKGDHYAYYRSGAGQEGSMYNCGGPHSTYLRHLYHRRFVPLLIIDNLSP